MKTDCWSFGCILYALITGKPPFESQSVNETLKKVQNKSKLLIDTNISEDF